VFVGAWCLLVGVTLPPDWPLIRQVVHIVHADPGSVTVELDELGRPPLRARRRSAPVTVTRPDPDAWALALRLAGGDAKRLLVVSPVEIIIANNPRRKR